MSGFWRDLAGLIRHPRRWWWNATHALCPVCRAEVNVGREWHEHKATHDRQDWRRALR